MLVSRSAWSERKRRKLSSWLSSPFRDDLIRGLEGELASVAAAALFGLSSTFFTLAGRRVGPSTVNRARLFLAAVLALGLHWATRDEPLPSSATAGAWLWLGLSGIIGLALGDASLFHAYVRIGPALSMLIFSTTPIFTSFFGYVLLGESLTAVEWAGMVVTLLGIAWVVSEPKRRDFHGDGGSYRAGLLFAAGGALGQALGLLTAKLGLAEGVAPQSANLMRLLGAAAFIWVAALLTGAASRTHRLYREDSRASVFTLAGTAAGPIFGVWLSLVAIDEAPLGIASTLMGLTPIFLLPIARLVFSEPISTRAVLGTLVALSGATILLR
jgi:drug/metabolite transporter (DMT)-like permease